MSRLLALAGLLALLIACGDDTTTGQTPPDDSPECTSNTDCPTSETCQAGECTTSDANNPDNNPDNNNDPGCTPSTEACDGVDNDCDDLIDEGCDVDGDQIEDVIVTNYGWGDEGQGRVWIYRGPVLGELDHDLAHTLTGPPGAQLGFFATHGDLNGDGIEDLVLACISLSDTGADCYAHVVYGPITGDRDLGSEPDAVITGEPGLGFVKLAVGDVTGDGYDDIVLRANPLSPTFGETWVVPGGPE